MATFSGSSAVEIDAPPQACFDLVCDATRTPDWQQAVTSAEVLERDCDGRASLVRTRIDAIVDRIELDLRFSYAWPHRIEIERESGELKRLTASWTFEDVGAGRTRATYATQLDPGRVASLLARGPIVAKLRELITQQPPRGLKAMLER